MIQKKHIKQVKGLLNGTLTLACLFFLSNILTAQAVVWNEHVTEEEVLEMARPMTSVVEIKTFGGIGSGVLITDRHVLTAKHVVMNPYFHACGYDLIADRMYITIEDALGNKTSIMAKGVYLHPSDADIAIIELPHSVAQLLNDDEGNPTIIPSSLYREDPRHLCGAPLHGAGYGKHAMATDERLRKTNGKRYYYETFFNFVLDTACFPDSETLTHLRFNIRDIINRNGDLKESLKRKNLQDSIDTETLSDLSLIRVIIDSITSLDPTLFFSKIRLISLMRSEDTLRHLLNVSFEIGLHNRRLEAEATFMGNVESGDSGSPLLNKEGQLVAVMTETNTYTAMKTSLASHSSMGELVYPFLGWIDDVTAGREVEMHSVNSYTFAMESLMYYVLYSAATGELPESYLYGVLAFAGVMDCTGIISEALLYDFLISKLAEASYLEAFIPAFLMYLTGS